MESRILFFVPFGFLLYLHFVSVAAASGGTCQGLSADVKCQCDGYGRCMKGTVEVDPWMQYALKTQRELQIDFLFNHIQMFGAHNAFNGRVYGPVYGANDTCQWPPPYDNICLGLANQEFSIVDMLNMGVRSFEIDNWWCADAMRVAHLGLPRAIWCGDFNVLLDDILADIGNWMDEPGNEDDFIHIYFNEKYLQEHDDAMNGGLERYLGRDRILSPKEFKNNYGSVWPTLRQLRKDGKRVLVTAKSSATHQGKYIHAKSCKSYHADEFTNYPKCGGKNATNCQRYTSDATHYVFGSLYDGPTRVGVVTDLTEMVKCRINVPANDMVNPQLMETAVYTWAKGEPSLELHENTCVLLNHKDYRWYTSPSCDQSLSYACQSLSDPDVWTISEVTGPYDVTHDLCPIGYKFSVPHNGFRQEKLTEKMNGKSVWLNYTPWITGIFPSPEPVEYTSPVWSGSATRAAQVLPRSLVLALVSLILIIILT